MRCTPFVVALLAHALALPPSLAVAVLQEAPPAAQQTEVPTFGVGTAAVTLDVVVRDKKGRAVRDLKASDFAVFEDGVKQTIESFRVFGRPRDDAADETPKAASAPSPASPSAPPAPSPTETRPQVIAFVFDRLSADARNTAHKAALTYLDQGHVEGDFVGIFAIDLALRTIQPFTKEPALIRLGLERAVSQANTQFSSDRGQARELAEAAMSAEGATDAIAGATPSGPGAGSAGSAIAGAAASAAIAQAVASRQLTMLRSFEALERDQQGFASTNGLLAVVNGLKELPGRKTVVFFSEGLAIPANVVAQFRSVIHTANRSNVSVYAMDAAGLRAESMDQETRKEMLQAGARRLRQLESGRDDASGGSMTKVMERNEDLLRLNPESGLGQLAKETGGFLIRDTNDAAAAFRRMEEDMRFHYLLAYSPSNENYDGRFRSVSVKVVRPSLQVQTREGYFAVRAVESVPLKSFEAPAIAQLDRSPRPSQFPLRALALSFPTTRRPGLVPVLVQVPGNTISYLVDRDDKSGKSMYRADLSVVVRVKNEAKQEVDRLSQHYLLSVPAANLEAARKGEVLFYREAELPAGKYTLEAVAYDAMAGKASVRTGSFEVAPADDTHVRLSSLMLVQRSEKVGASEPKDGPLYYGDTLLYPNMGEVYKKSTAKTLGFFFSALSPRDGPAPGEAMVEVWRGAQAVGQVATPLPAPDAQGRIQQAGALPLSGFAAGAYELKVTLRDGKNVASSSAPFTVEE
jgi:VWFA-related protein